MYVPKRRRAQAGHFLLHEGSRGIASHPIGGAMKLASVRLHGQIYL